MRGRSCGPFFTIAGLGSAAIQQLLSATDEGSIKLSGTNLGTVTLESDDEREITQPIESVSASIKRSESGIHLSIRGAVGAARVDVFGIKAVAAAEPDAADIVPIGTFEIEMLIPAALLIVRYQRLRRSSAARAE